MEFTTPSARLSTTPRSTLPAPPSTTKLATRNTTRFATRSRIKSATPNLTPFWTQPMWKTARILGLSSATKCPSKSTTALAWSATTPRCSLAATEVTQWARGRPSPATVPSEDTPQVLSATPTLRDSASRGPSRTPGRSQGRPATLSQGRSVSQLPVRSVSLSLAKCVSLWRPRFPDRSARPQGLMFPSTATLEKTKATLLEPALLLVLDLASPLVQEDMDMAIKPNFSCFVVE